MRPETVENRLSTLERRISTLPEVTEPPKTTLEILNRSRRERHWHDLLGYFLDPTEPHGYGGDVLENVLRVVQDSSNIAIPSFDLERCEIRSEVAGPEGRPDLVVLSDREWFILIELKVGAGEGKDQTKRYVEDDRIGDVPKSEFPVDGHNYIYISSRNGSGSNAEEFVDISWEDIVEAIEPLLLTSRGRHPMKSEAQLSDFVDTIREEMKLSEDTYDKRQRKTIELYGEFQDAIEEARATFDEAVAEEPNRWYDRFPSEFRPETWDEGWKCGETRSGQIYRKGWRLDDTLTPTDSVASAPVQLQFVHFLRDRDVVREGKLKFQLKWGGNGDRELRDRFSDWFDRELSESDLSPEEHGIKKSEKTGVYTEKVYEFDIRRFPDSYYETLRVAFDEHKVIADFLSDREAVKEIVRE